MILLYRLIFVAAILLLLSPTYAQEYGHLDYQQRDSLSELLVKKADYRNALPLILESYQKAKSERGIIDSITASFTKKMAFLHWKINDFEAAEKITEEYIDICNKTFSKEHPEYANSLIFEAYALAQQKSYDKAIEVAEGALKLIEATQGIFSTDYLTVLGNAALYYEYVEDYEKAETYYLKAIRLKLQLEETPDNLHHTMINLGVFYKDINLYDKALNYMNEGVKYASLTYDKNHPEYAYALLGLSTIYSYVRHYEEAELLLIQTAEIYRNVYGEEHLQYINAIGNLATVYYYEEKYKEAEALTLKAMQLSASLYGSEQSPLYVSFLKSLCLTYTKTQKFAKAEFYAKKALNLVKAALGENHPKLVGYLNDVGFQYHRAGKFEQAMQYYSDAIELSNQSGMPRSLDRIIEFNNMSELYNDMGDPVNAIKYSMVANALNTNNFSQVFPKLFRDSSSDYRYLPEFFNTKWIDIDYAKILELQFNDVDQMNKATNNLLDALRLSIENNSAPNLGNTYQQLAIAAVLINTKVRDKLHSASNKLELFKSINKYVKHGIDAAKQIGSTECLADAFMLAEQNKSILLTDAIKGNRAVQLGRLPDTIKNQEATLKKEKENYSTALQQSVNDAEKNSSISKLNEINQALEKLETLIQTKYPEYYALKYEDITASVREIQEKLDKKSLFIEYLVADSMAYTFVIGKEKLDIITVTVSLSRLKYQIKKLRESIIDYQFITMKSAYNQYVKNAHWFYENLIAPIDIDKQIETLIIVPDNELSYLPFEAFLTSVDRGKKQKYSELNYLLLDYNISYAYSATLWKKNQEKIIYDNGEMLAFASAYESIDASINTLRSIHNINQRSMLKPLPDAENEIIEIGKYYKGTFLLKEQANEHAFKEKVKDYGIIHLAMHGLLNEQSPILSSLAFTENYDTLEDNFLHAYEISNLDLKANLVVLSACETGYGKFEQGEGVVSLARSFMYAGCPSMLMSLWQVSDKPTALIMQYFYKYLAEGMPKDKALRIAKLAYIKAAKGLMAHPAFWSPFIQLGNASAIPVAKKGGNLSIFLMAGFGVIALLFWGYRRKKVA